jgi:ATP-binding cassette, subfamily C (CFTR/MRP), member 2
MSSSSSSSSAWLTSPSCTLLPIHSSSSTPNLILPWLRFIFLSPCPQRLLLSSLDSFFLLFLLAFTAQKLYSRFYSRANTSSSITKPLLQKNDSDYRITFWFKLPLLATTILAITYIVLGILAFTQTDSFDSWKQIEALFRLFQAITNIGIVILMIHEKKFKSSKHPLSLRIYWTANFLIASLFAASALVRMMTVGETKLELSLRIDDIFSLVNFPLSLFFLVISIKGSSGIHVIRISDVVATYPSVSTDRTLSPYACSSFLSKTVWYWMNPLLNKGYQTPLKLEDVPSLPLDFRAEKMSELFQNNWPKPEENSKHPVGVTLFRCFWKHIAFTGFLAIIKLCLLLRLLFD